MTSPFESDTGLPRRSFLAAGAGAFLCTIGGEPVLLSKPGDAAKADAAARRVAAPRARAAAAGAPGAGPTEQLTFTTPQPQPGGTAREYWIEAREALWDVVPSRPRRDEWHGRAVAGPSVYRAFVYPIGVGVLLFGGPADGGQQQPHLRQLPDRRGRAQADPTQADRRRRSHRQPGPRQPVRARRGGPQPS